MNRSERIFKKMEALGILSVTEHAKAESGPYMPLNVDRLGPNLFAIAHNFIHNGDVMAAPDMVVEVHWPSRNAEVISYQQASLGIYQEVYVFDESGKKIGVRPSIKKQLNAFLESWLNNLKKQGFSCVVEEVAA